MKYVHIYNVNVKEIGNTINKVNIFIYNKILKTFYTNIKCLYKKVLNYNFKNKFIFNNMYCSCVKKSIMCYYYTINKLFNINSNYNIKNKEINKKGFSIFNKFNSSYIYYIYSITNNMFKYYKLYKVEVLNE